MQKLTYPVYILFLFAMSGCGKPPGTAPEFSPYVQRFLASAAEHGKPMEAPPLNVQFGETQGKSEVGFCTLSDGEAPSVTVNQTKWDHMDEDGKESFLFHELGHCLLGRLHRPEVNENGVPVSLMNPYTIDSGMFHKLRTYYMKELFSRSK